MWTLLAGLVVAHGQSLEFDRGSAALAESGRFGLGLGGGTLSNGVSGKLYLSDRLAAQALVGWWLGAGFSVGADLIYERAFFQSADLTLNLYGGAGPALGVFTVETPATLAAVAAVGGAGLHLVNVPVEVAIELRPTVLIGDNFWNGFYFGAGGAVRYYF